LPKAHVERTLQQEIKAHGHTPIFFEFQLTSEFQGLWMVPARQNGGN
jgi:hypothetical protein